MLKARTLAEWEAEHSPVEAFTPDRPESPPLDWQWERRAVKWYALVVLLLACPVLWQVREEHQRQVFVRREQQRKAMLTLELQPPPTVARGPAERRSGGGSAGTWVVTGAGDATYNGTYRKRGALNGQPAYTNGSKWLWYIGGHWLLTEEPGVADPDAPYGSSPGELPGNPWVPLLPYRPPS
ncbi:MAG: hypothetical protein ABFE07_07410 [Armatimonadia bacterium]